MKTLLLTLFCCWLAPFLHAIEPNDSPPATKLTSAELDELLGPIALYPDALIALILPASTFPSDVVLAARFVASDGDPARVEDKPWDSSVKALTRYPDTLKWLDENLEWTTQVGDAFIDQPVEVMEAIQHLRAEARALGNLNDTPQQRIIQDDTDIRIIPAQPDYIYEPRYDPDVIFYERADAGPLLFFSSGYGVGSWLDYDFDWHRHRIYRGDWHEGWDYRRDSNRRDREDYFSINNKLTNVREWHPDPARHHAQSHRSTRRPSDERESVSRMQSQDKLRGSKHEHHSGVERPKAISGAPHHPDGIKRGDLKNEGKSGKGASPKSMRDNSPGEVPKGHLVKPKSEAPGSGRDGKHGDDVHEKKKAPHESEHVVRHPEEPSKKASEGKPHSDSPKHESMKKDEPRKREGPSHDEPKRKEAPKNEEPKHREAPKHEKEMPKHEEARKHQDAPKHEADKPHSESSKKKGKKDDDKKKD